MAQLFTALPNTAVLLAVPTLPPTLRPFPWKFPDLHSPGYSIHVSMTALWPVIMYNCDVFWTAIMQDSDAKGRHLRLLLQIRKLEAFERDLLYVYKHVGD